MPSNLHPFYPYSSTAGTIVLLMSTLPAPVQLTTGFAQGALLTNLSTLAMNILISPSSLTTLSTLSSAGFTAGFLISGGTASKQVSISIPPNGFITGMTTGTGLSGYIGVSLGEGMI